MKHTHTHTQKTAPRLLALAAPIVAVVVFEKSVCAASTCLPHPTSPLLAQRERERAPDDPLWVFFSRDSPFRQTLVEKKTHKAQSVRVCIYIYCVYFHFVFFSRVGKTGKFPTRLKAPCRSCGPLRGPSSRSCVWPSVLEREIRKIALPILSCLHKVEREKSETPLYHIERARETRARSLSLSLSLSDAALGGGTGLYCVRTTGPTVSSATLA